MVEEAFDVSLDNPLCLPVGNDFGYPSQRIVRTAPGAKAIRAVTVFRLPDGLQDAAELVLDQAVLEARHAQWPVASVSFRDVAAPYRLRPVAQSAYPCREVLQARLHTLGIVLFPYPIDSGRLASILAPKAFAQALGVRQYPHQGVEPRLRLLARLQCETIKFGCHGHNPLGVGPCFARSFSQTATPWLHPHYQASLLLWMAPTSIHHCPCPRFLHSFTGACLRRTDVWISLVTTLSQCQARHGLGPRGVPLTTCQGVAGVVACRRVKPVGTHQPKFSGLNTFRGGFTRYLCTSPAFVPTHPQGCCQSPRQGSILGSWLTITQAGLSPARERGIAKPH